MISTQYHASTFCIGVSPKIELVTKNIMLPPMYFHFGSNKSVTICVLEMIIIPGRQNIFMTLDFIP